MESQSKRKASMASMRAILDAAEMYRALGTDYPSSIQEMLDARGEMGRPNPIIKGETIDPWNRPFEYTLIDGSPQVRCLGRDGMEGGEGEDSDIVMPAPSGQCRKFARTLDSLQIRVDTCTWLGVRRLGLPHIAVGARLPTFVAREPPEDAASSISES